MGEDDFFRLVASARNPDRLFAVQSNKRQMFYAGSCAGGVQGLIGRWYTEHILVLLFSKEGYLWEFRRQELPRFRSHPEHPHLDINDREFHAFLHAEYGFEAATVRVQQFMVQDEGCGFWVGSLPWHFNQALAEMLASPKVLADGRWVADRELMCDFISRGQHVIHWANDWRMLDSEGRDAG